MSTSLLVLLFCYPKAACSAYICPKKGGEVD